VYVVDLVSNNLGGTVLPLSPPTLLTTPAAGTASISGDILTYTPPIDFIGPITFTYQLLTSHPGLSGSITLTYAVIPTTRSILIDLDYAQSSSQTTVANSLIDLSYSQSNTLAITTNSPVDLSYSQSNTLATTKSVVVDIDYIQQNTTPTVQLVQLDLLYAQALTDSFVNNKLESAVTMTGSIVAQAAVSRLFDIVSLTESYEFFLTDLLTSAMALDDEVVGLVDIISQLSDAIGVKSTPADISSVLIALSQLEDQIGIDDPLLLAAFYDILESGIQLNSSSTQFLVALANLVENMTISEEVLSIFNLVRGLLQSGVQLTESYVSSCILKAQLCEDATFLSILNDENLPKGLGNFAAKEGWVMNPHTFAVWNYSHYDFNTIRTLECGNVLATNSQGLFEIDGKKDVDLTNPILNTTNPIQSKLTTASIRLGTSAIKQVPEAYLGIESNGKLVFSVRTDERVWVNYRLNKTITPNFNSQVQIGKGLIGSKWQFQIIDEDSEDFIMTNIELYPVVFGRKRR
jgi:hypothetical protein